MTRVRITSTPEWLALWFVDLDSNPDVEGLRNTLSTDEAQRADRFRFEEHRRRFIAGRAALRSVLARRMGCKPAQVTFSYGACGKPYVRGHEHDLCFNMAHSDDDAVVAIGRQAAVGVDIERVRPIPDLRSVAASVFSSAELRELDEAADPLRAFLRGWTRKEAYVKAVGVGCTRPLTAITVSLSDRPALLSRCDESLAFDWDLYDVSHPTAVVAVALGRAAAAHGLAHIRHGSVA